MGAISRAAVLWILLALTTAACTTEPSVPGAGPVTSPPAASPRPGGGVAYAYVREPATLDPAAAVGPGDLLVVEQVFDPLTSVQPDLSVAPAAAVSWDVDETATVFTFRLRAGATFHDGSPVTAASFKHAWERVADRDRESPSPAHHLLNDVVGIDAAREGGPFEGVEAIGARTLRVTLTAPNVEFPALVSHPALSPLPEAALQRPAELERMPIGNGPFRMAEPWQPGQFIRLEAVAEHDARPELEQVVLRIYTGEEAGQVAFDDFVQGKLDLAPVPDDRLDEAVSLTGHSSDGYSGPGLLDGVRTVVAYYGFNVEVPPFDDPVVRRALAALVDRDALASAGAGDHRVPAKSIVPPELLPGYEVPECPSCVFDAGLARELLADRELEPIELVYLDVPDHAAVARRFQRTADTALGAGTLRLRPLGQQEWLDAVRSGDAGFFLGGWTPEYPSPGAYLRPLFHPSSIGRDNLTNHVDDEVAALLDAARAEMDPERRNELYAQAEARVLADIPVIPLFFYRHARVASDRVEGLVLNPMGIVDLAEISLRGGG